ncbi:MAG: type secretion system protein [Sphingomonas bacterium]|nr:type II secretion system protein N [Sphingomonas bacterium]MDB5688358.1 type secretion system protein [Sphingomonas bacterium]
MRRIRLPLGRGLFFLCAFLFAAVALLPLRLALDWLAIDTLGVSARQAEGSIWLGALREVRIGGGAIGDLRARLDPLPLAAGRARVEMDRLERSDAGLPLRGAVIVSRHALGVDDVSASLPIGASLAPLPIRTLDLTEVNVRFRDGLCDHADGLVKAQLAGDVAGISLPAGLTGNARCEGGALMLPLASQGGAEMLSLAIQGSGSVRAELLVRPGGDAARARLLGLGFLPVGDRLRLAVDATL